MKFGGIVLHVNMHQMIKSDFWVGVIVLRSQSLKGSSPSSWGSSGTWPGRIPRKTTIMSSLPHYVHHLTGGGDPPVVQEPLGWERLGRTCSHRILGSTRHGGRQRREILGIWSSVRQRSARSSPPRRCHAAKCCRVVNGHSVSVQHLHSSAHQFQIYRSFILVLLQPLWSVVWCSSLLLKCLP